MSMHSEMVKTAQFQAGQKRSKPKNLAYPRYDRSLVSQRHKDPMTTGIIRGTETGITGAALGALIARVVSGRAKDVGIGAALGGVAGSIPGFISGKQEAESENSKLLFLRRRLGINEPGELETVLQNPRLATVLADNKEFKKAPRDSEKQAAANPAVRAAIRRAIIGALAGGGLGAGWGYKVSPEISGYADVEPVRRISGVTGTISGAITGAILGLLGKSPSKLPPGVRGLRSYLSQPAQVAKGVSGAVAGYVVPELVFSDMANKARNTAAIREQADATLSQAKATGAQAEATSEQANKQVAPTIIRALKSKTGRGALAGTALAGLAGLGTGLTRSRTDDEIRKDRSRMDMIKSDILKYVVPLALGGGVVGSVVK